jgi:hypothetical protein
MGTHDILKILLASASHFCIPAVRHFLKIKTIEVQRSKSKLYGVLVGRQVLAWQGSNSVFDA